MCVAGPGNNRHARQHGFTEDQAEKSSPSEPFFTIPRQAITAKRGEMHGNKSAALKIHDPRSRTV
jgi:hypothetical protein